MDLIPVDTDMYGVTTVQTETAFPTALIIGVAAVAIIAAVLIIKAIKKKK